MYFCGNHFYTAESSGKALYGGKFGVHRAAIEISRSLFSQVENRNHNGYNTSTCFDRSTDRTAVSGTANAGSIPARSANIHTPLLLASDSPRREAPAELAEQRGVHFVRLPTQVCLRFSICTSTELETFLFLPWGLRRRPAISHSPKPRTCPSLLA